MYNDEQMTVLYNVLLGSRLSLEEGVRQAGMEDAELTTKNLEWLDDLIFKCECGWWVPTEGIGGMCVDSSGDPVCGDCF